jgi:hypothetical protein
MVRRDKRYLGKLMIVFLSFEASTITPVFPLSMDDYVGINLNHSSYL